MSFPGDVPIRFVDSLVEDGVCPGDAKWFANGSVQTAGLNFVCPCGCGQVAGVSVEPGRWQWDGNRERPTITPSIQIMDGCRWHGFLTNGVFQRC
jgi:hypothetical protein